MFCQNCGAEINDNAVICVKCGCIVKKHVNMDSTTYILLAVFLGAFGAHNFYIGNKKTGTIQLLLSVLSCFILALPVNIWAIIEACSNAKNLE